MYLKKKELLEWIEREQNNLDWSPPLRLGFLQTKKKIQSGAFDADDLIGDWIGERCPKCGADMLANKVGDKWCSLVGCDYSINAPEGDGNDA